MIDPVGASSSLSAMESHSQHPLRAVLDSVADLLGMSKDELRAGLRSGQSLSDLATQKGISQDQLLSTVTQALQSTPLPPGTDVNALAQAVIERKGGHHHHHHHQDADSAQNGTQPGVTGADTPNQGSPSVDVIA